MTWSVTRGSLQLGNAETERQRKPFRRNRHEPGIGVSAFGPAAESGSARHDHGDRGNHSGDRGVVAAPLAIHVQITQLLDVNI
jgi:hypothetical protein